MTSKYTLSPAIRSFIQQCEIFFPPAVVEQGIESQRAAYNKMTAHFARPRSSSLRIHDTQLNGITVRHYQPKQTNSSQRILFAHGGGWYLGGLDSHDSFCASLAMDCKLTVIAVDYRLAPEAPYPAGLNDLSAVYQALLQDESLPPLLLGDSAGGNLVAALTLRCRNTGVPKACGQILIYPALAAPGSLPSHQLFADAPLLDSASINFCWQNYASKKHPFNDEELFPLQAESLALLPPAAIFAAEFDPLIDDARYYNQRLRQAEVPTRLIQVPGLVHGALHSIGLTSEAEQLYQSICTQVLHMTNHRAPIKEG